MGREWKKRLCIYIYMYVCIHKCICIHTYTYICMNQFSRSIMSDSLWPHGLQHARPPCPSSPRACPNSYQLNQWCHPTISSCHPLLLLIFPSIRVLYVCTCMYVSIWLIHIVIQQETNTKCKATILQCLKEETPQKRKKLFSLLRLAF